MIRALRYFTSEALASLSRGWRAAALAVLTIAAGLFVLGFFLVIHTNLQPVLDRWTQAAELSVFLADEVTPEQQQAVERTVDASGLAASRELVSREDAARRFRQDFPDLAHAQERLERNPFPASVDVRLRDGAVEREADVRELAAALAALPGVVDVRYDQRWLSRLAAAVRLVRGIGLTIVAMLALAAALTVANVVRLAAYARRDEIEIMQLVGAPHAYVRGPFVMEGVLQGGAGALVALLALWGLFVAGRGRFGADIAQAANLGPLTFLPAGWWILLVLGGMALGSLGGLMVARSVK